MKKLVTMTIISIMIVSCNERQPKVPESSDILKTFNLKASNIFREKYSGSTNLDIMDKRERCIMEKTIENYLDHSNNWLTSVIDSFYVRSYNFSDFIDEFSFVSNSQEKFYFIYSPEFSDRFIASEKYYTKEKSGLLKLNESPDNYAVKLNMSFLNEFLESELTHTKDFSGQVAQTKRLLPFLLPHQLRNKARVRDLTDSLSKRPVEQANIVVNSLQSVIPAQDLKLSISSTTYEVYRNFVGFTVVHYRKSSVANDKLEVDFYLIPDQYSYPHLRDTEPLFVECNHF